MRRARFVLFLTTICAAAFVGLVRAQIESINPAFQVSFNAHLSTMPVNGNIALSNLNTRLIDVNPIPSGGSLAYPAITPGRYRMDVRGEGIEPVSREVRIDGNGSQEETVDLSPAKGSSSYAPPPPPPPARTSYFGPVVTCPHEEDSSVCVWVEATKLADALDKASEDLRESYKLSHELSEISAELLEGKETFLVAEEQVNRQFRSKLQKAELKLVDYAVMRMHENLVDLIQGVHRANGWAPPISAFRWDTPEQVAQKARAVVDDGIYVGQVAKEARKEARSNQMLSTSSVDVGGRPAHEFKTCGRISSCGDLVHVSVHGWTNQ